MSEPLIAKLQERLKEAFGASVVPYGGLSEDGTRVSFRIKGIEATFSALVSPEVPPGVLDIQIENYPPGDYIYVTQLPVDRFVELIGEYRKPIDQWPLEKDGA